MGKKCEATIEVGDFHVVLVIHEDQDSAYQYDRYMRMFADFTEKFFKGLLEAPIHVGISNDFNPDELKAGLDQIVAGLQRTRLSAYHKPEGVRAQ